MLTKPKIRSTMPPVKFRFMDGSYGIEGITPIVDYTPELFEELVKEFEDLREKRNKENRATGIQSFDIPSKRDPNKTYTVSLEYGRFTCTCKGYHFRRKCNHITSVKKELRSKK